ncbi:MAG TPA: chemotaxis protein CheA [Gemmatimonadales bacterium]|jgi:two-component system chemotaxis sensor kinase CheA|nr:chemotaxis protein CheA [Gemmatimonadales bacterium]
MDLSQYAELFLAESREHLSACNQLLLEWEQHPASAEPVAGLFRAVHTIKGMAATMGYGRVADLAHRIENLLDQLRRGGKTPAADTIQLLFRARDTLEQAVELAVAGRERDADLSVLEAIDQAAVHSRPAPQPSALARHLAPEPEPSPAAPAQAPAASQAASPVSGRVRIVHVTIRPEAPLKGARAMLVTRKAQGLGTVHRVQPPPAAFESDDFDGRFTFELDSAQDHAAIESAIRGVGDVERVTVGGGEEAVAPAESVAAGGRARHIRVDLRRLDTLMDLIGELVTERGRLNEVAARWVGRDPQIDDVAIQISRLSSDLQNEIIQARMTPVWQVFDRFPRLVRDVARQLNKQVTFRVEGKEIELDREILDELGDPLVHLLRNAVDHGIEPPAERKRLKKSPEGEVVLAAVRERSSVAISITDDGRGIDRVKILDKARREGVVGPHVEALSDDQLLRVLARPGFTTADAITSVSGRGVGIDVAMTRIRALGGSIEIRTDVGKGTSFILRLPVTLAIVRALIAAVGQERYALPLTYVAETVEYGTTPLTSMEGRDAIVLRDRVVPLVDLRTLLGTNGGAPPPPPRRPVIVLEMGERRAGIVVDGMLSQQEIVVKGFDAPQGTLPVFSGATIMGDGVPALILDAAGLV